jgi:hypothetical protein
MGICTRVERWIVYSALLVLSVATFVRMRSADAEGPEDATMGVLTVRELRVTDPQGVEVFRIASGTAGGWLAARNKDGKDVAYLGAANDTGGGLVTVSRKDAVRGAELSAGVRGGYLIAHAWEGKQVVYLGSASDTGVGFLNLSRTDGEGRAFLYAAEGGGGMFGVKRADGRDAVVLRSDEKGGLVRITDASDKTVDLPTGR